MKDKIAPSILSADFARLGDQVSAAEAAGIEQIHVDVMDGHFVPNLSMGPIVVQALKRTTDLPLDVHLMITDPEKYLEPFVKAGADHISFHVEVGGDTLGMLQWLRDQDVGCGIAVNPDTPVERVFEYLPHVDMVLVMTVHPGFGGQSFLGENLEKVRRVREKENELREAGDLNRELDIEVDGGIDAETITESKAAGANVYVAGNSIFGQPDVAEAIGQLRSALQVAQ